MKFKTFFHTLNLLNLPRQPFAIYIIIGLGCGLAAVAFHLSIEYVFEHVVAYQKGQDKWLSILLMILAPAFGGLIVGLVLFKIEPAAGGSGNSLGREEPTVHLCASIASQIGQRLKLRDDALLIQDGIYLNYHAKKDRGS